MKKIFALTAAAGLFALSTVASHAAPDPNQSAVSATISGNSTNFVVGAPAAGTLSLTLNGADQTTYGTLGAFNVTDQRGTGTGWTLSAHASPLTDGTHTIDNALYIAGTGADCASTVTCTGSVTGLTTGEYQLDGSGQQIADAALDNGMGTYTVTPVAFSGHAGMGLELKVPAGAYAGSYSSTITVTMAAIG
jgi:hypothetical protein